MNRQFLSFYLASLLAGSLAMPAFGIPPGHNKRRSQSSDSNQSSRDGQSNAGGVGSADSPQTTVGNSRAPDSRNRVPTREDINAEAERAGKDGVPIGQSTVIAPIADYPPVAAALKEIKDAGLEVVIRYVNTTPTDGGMETVIGPKIIYIYIPEKTRTNVDPALVVSGILHELHDARQLMNDIDITKLNGPDIDALFNHPSPELIARIEERFKNNPGLQDWFWRHLVSQYFMRGMVKIDSDKSSGSYRNYPWVEVLEKAAKSNRVPEGITFKNPSSGESITAQELFQHAMNEARTVLATIEREHNSYTAQVRAANDLGLAAGTPMIERLRTPNGVENHLDQNSKAYGADQKLLRELFPTLQDPPTGPDAP